MQKAKKYKIGLSASGFRAKIFGGKCSRFLFFGSGFGLIAIVAALIMILAVSASSTSAASRASTVKVSLGNGVAIRLLDKTLSSEVSNLHLDVNNTPAGAFVKDSFYVQVATSNPTGYKLYISSDYCLEPTPGIDVSNCITHTNALVNEAAPSYTFPTLTSAVSEADFSKDNSEYKNKWGYAKSWDGGGDGSTYLAVPDYNSTDLIRETDSASSASNTLITIGLNAGMDNIPGTYRNNLVFTGIGNPVPVDYSVSFDANGDNVSGMPTVTLSDTVTAGVAAFTLPDDTPTREGYVFSGWINPNVKYGKRGSIIDTYSPGETIIVNADPETLTGDVVLKAKWIGTSWATITTMQEMTTDICSAAPMEETKTLIDIRPVDSNGTTRSYTVAKLKDNHCWMTQNLRLVGSEPIELTEKDSQVPSAGFTLSASDDEKWCQTINATCINQSKTLDTDRNDYGAYYNWFSATAGSGTYETISENANYSICPKQWRLPTGGSTGEWKVLYDNYPTVLLMFNAPVSLVKAGDRNGLTWSQETNSFYNTSTAYTTNGDRHAILLNSPGSVVDLVAVRRKYIGYSIRCLAQ